MSCAAHQENRRRRRRRGRGRVLCFQCLHRRSSKAPRAKACYRSRFDRPDHVQLVAAPFPRVLTPPERLAAVRTLDVMMQVALKDDPAMTTTWNKARRVLYRNRGKAAGPVAVTPVAASAPP